MKKDEIIKWVVGIVLVIYMIFQLYVSFSFSYSLSEISDNLDDITAPYTQFENQEASIKESLTEDGYEVLSVHIMNYSSNAPFFDWYDIEDNTICAPDEEYCYSDKVGVSVTMKSLGSRNEQIWDVLTNMYVRYPNAFTYRITIKSPTDTCEYILFGEYGIIDWFENYDLEARDDVQYQIDNLVSCS
jgi:hypothetical protein